ncbi:MAG: hypothetical protein HFF17_01700 [Oscillospiraceae bacterium]|nr:hypothetical protein [Oscillospiraceae bacterium]
MKRIFCIVSALTLAALMAGCANTAVGPDMAPGYDNTYGTYGTTPGYGSSGSYSGNVSTTHDGRINGTNGTTGTRGSSNASGTARTDRTGRTSTRPVNRTTTGSGSAYNDAMGAGMNG